jgi:4'-phosphopantetheinyl transferase
MLRTSQETQGRDAIQATVTVDLWSWPLVGGDVALLSPDERDRADRFRFPRDRDRFVAGRVRLRAILGGYLDRPPGEVKFRYGPWGRPEVDWLFFSLAHSGGRALLAVLPEVPVGADVEVVRPLDPDLAQIAFAPGERQALAALPAPEQGPAFFRGWTRKEAYLKARGTGLSTDLSSFEVTLGAGDARLLRCASGEVSMWRLADVDMGPGAASAVAARTGGRTLRLAWRLRG